MNTSETERIIARKWPMKLFAVLVVVAIAATAILAQLGGTLAAPADKVVTLQCESGVSQDFHVEKGETKTLGISYLSDARSTDTGIATVEFTAAVDGEAGITGVKAGIASLIYGNIAGKVGAFKFQITDSENISGYTLKDGGEMSFDAQGETKACPVVDVTGQASRIVWSSMNESVATVAANGDITSVGPGMTVVTGDFTDKWGVPRYINIVVGVGENAGNPSFTVTGIEVTPGGPLDIHQDGYELFSATVKGTGDVPQGVTWQIQHSTHSGITISSNGLLQVPFGLQSMAPEDEYIIIRAASAAEPSVYKDVQVDLLVNYFEPEFYLVLGSPIYKNEPLEAALGSNQQFSAVAWNSKADITQDVVWKVIENESASTTISPGGLLTIASDETAGYLVVRATYFVKPLGANVSRYVRVNLIP